ncbi:MAG: amphi-Trp domain-containing protein [Actinomycetota bacterium]|nr:amphi-Trp domain-containing protein [Actinomycetota bacterium]
MSKGSRDVERVYSTSEVVAKLRRLADALETGTPFRIQVAGERIHVPARAQFSIEHERGSDEEEVEFQLKWSLAEVSQSSEEQEPLV